MEGADDVEVEWRELMVWRWRELMVWTWRELMVWRWSGGS